jgi:cysteine desulfurase
MSTRIYLDWNAGAPLLPEARERIADLLAAGAGNPSSVHVEGRRLRDLVETAREDVAALVNVGRGELVLTSGGSEANAMALRGLAARGGRHRGCVLALPGVEHPSVLATAEQLSLEGTVVRRLPVDADGVVALESLADLLQRGQVTVVCVQLANSETGVVQPVERVAALAHAHGAAVHCDAVQAAGKLAVDMAALGIDTMALSAHKLGGLPGAGALAVREGAAIAPLIPGTQERHRRGGTENVAGIVAFGAAARVARERGRAWQSVAALRDRLEDAVAARAVVVRVYGRAVARLPNTSCLGLPPPCLGGVMVAALDLRGFAVSSGSACSSGVERGSIVVEAMGYGEEAARRTLRVSLGPLTGEGEVHAFVETLADIVERRKGGRP